MAQNKQIGLLFGVEGGNSLDGQSGKRISQQIMAIAHNISNKQKPAITFKVDEKRTTNQIQLQLDKIAKGLVIQIGGLDSKSIEANAKKESSNLLNHYQTVVAKLNGLGLEKDNTKYANTGIKAVTKQFERYLAVVNEAKAIEKSNGSNPTTEQQQALIEKMKRVGVEKTKLDALLQNGNALERQSLGYNKVIDSITKYQLKNAETLKNTPKFAAALEQLRAALAGGTYEGDAGKAHNEFLRITNDIRMAGGEAETLGQKIKRIFGQKFGFGIMATAALYARQALRQVYKEVVEVDSALTQLSIVTGKSMSTLRSGLDGVVDSAREANTSIKDILKSMETYSRLGFNLEDSESMAKVTNMYANVANTDATAATDALTAILKGYDYDPSQLESIADELVKVGQEYAISAGELGSGLQIAGATLNITGTNLEKSIALLASGNSALQDADRVANALKTSALRIQGTEANKKELEEMGEDISDLAEGTSKLRNEIKSLSGVDIMKSETQYKDMYDIMVELSGVWDKLTDTQRNTILEDIAGKRNSSVIASIITNLKDLEGAYGAASNASGTLAKANKVYSDSIEGRINKIKTTFTEVSNNLLDSGLIKGVISLGDGLLKVANFLGEIKALLPVIIAGFMSWKNVGKSNSQNMPAYAQLQLVA